MNMLLELKKNYIAGMKPIQIAKLFHISSQKVSDWGHHPIVCREKGE